jgi:glycosyltransferase involved in cell wall biosynthesis
MPKLLQINTTANWGSTGKIAEQIGIHAMRHGWESTIAYGYYINPSKSQIIKIGSKWGVRWHRQISKYGKGDGRGSILATRKLIKQIETIKPDIIHLHNIHGLYLNYPILFNYLNSIDTPVVWTMHDCWSFTGRCAYFDSVECSKWHSGCQGCPALGLYPKTRRDYAAENFRLKQRLFTAKRNMVLVPVSEWLGDLVGESMLKDCHKRIIHNGIDIDTFSPKPCDKREDRHLILGVAAQWGTRKGLTDFYKLRTMLDTATYDITLIGLSDEQIATLPEGITGIRRTQNVGELAEYYSRASVFVNPTYSDNYPTTNLEAMACGTPVITYLTGGSPEAVSTTTGVVVEQGNITALKEAIEGVCSKGKAAYSEACRKRAEELFDKDRCFENYIRLYDELLTK